MVHQRDRQITMNSERESEGMLKLKELLILIIKSSLTIIIHFCAGQCANSVAGSRPWSHRGSRPAGGNYPLMTAGSTRTDALSLAL